MPVSKPSDLVGGPNPQAVIFDFDGLLMDTESTSLESWRFEWQQWGLKLDESNFFVNHGGDISEDRYSQLSEAVGERFDRSLSQERRTQVRDRLDQALDLADGMRNWIAQAIDSHTRLALASSSPRVWLVEHLGRAGVMDCFEVVAAGDEVAHHKPAPDVYELALNRLRLRSEQAIAVEDTAHGVDAAHAAGLRCIAIPNPYVSTGAVAHAELVLPSASTLSIREALAQCLGARHPRRSSS